jgi:hypothetical protein
MRGTCDDDDAHDWIPIALRFARGCIASLWMTG